MKKPTVFITGASGFVGANLTRKLLTLGYDVHVLLRETNSWRLKEIISSLRVHTGSLLDKSFLEKVFKKTYPDYIFHLAAFGAYPFQTDDQQMVTTNIVGLSNLLHATKDIPYACFVNTGSSSEYGHTSKPMRESDAISPDSFYASTKASATYYSQVFAKTYNKPIITFRLFSVYGPYEEPTRLIPTAIVNSMTNKVLQITSGQVRRDFVYVDDVVSAYLHTLSQKITPGDIYNIGTGIETSNTDIAKIIHYLSHNQLSIQKGGFPQRSWDKTHWKADISHTSKVFKWKSSTDISTGLSQTYQWFLDNRKYYKNIYEKI